MKATGRLASRARRPHSLAMRLAALIAAFSLPAIALAEGPRYYAAPGPVAVREAPSTEADEIGRISGEAAAIEVTLEEDGWGRIPWRGQDGWVRLDGLSPAEIDRLEAVDLPAALLCTGTEPFWSLAFTGPGEAIMGGPDIEPVPLAVSTGLVAAGRLAFPAALWLDGPDGPSLALFRPLACSDGMSDSTYGWTVDLLTRRGDGSALLTGCCRLPMPE